MKKIVIALFAACATLVACQKEQAGQTETNGKDVVLHIIASQADATKTTLSGTDAKWAAGDKVTVLYNRSGSTWTTAESASAYTTDAYATATFSATLSSPTPSSTAYAIYPSNAISQNGGDNAKIQIAATQHPTSTGFDGDSDIMISDGITLTSATALAATTQFARCGAVLKISIDNATLASEKLVSLSVTGANPLAGNVLVGLSDHEVKGIESGSNTVTAEYAPANQFEVNGHYVYLIVKPQTLASGSHLVINGVTRNYTFTKDITLPNDIHLSAGHIMPLNINITSTTLTSKVDVLTRTLTGVSKGAGYTAWSGKSYSGGSDAVYAGTTAGGNDAIQLNANSGSSYRGIVSTASGGRLNKVAVVWNSNTSTDRTITIYGKNTAYSASDLNNSFGTNLGTIKMGTSTYLNIDAYYEFVMIKSSEAIYLDEVNIFWGNAKSAAGIKWTADGLDSDAVSSRTATRKTGDDIMPAASLYNPNGLSVTYSSTNEAVAAINSTTGVISLITDGETTIKASFAGDETYKPAEVSYTLTVTDSRTSCATPSFSVAAGAVAENTSVRVKSDTPDATVYYKIGSAPTISSYDGVSTLKEDGTNKPYIDVTIDAAKTIYAIAVKDDWKDSSVGSAAYSIIGEAAPLSNPSSVAITAITRTSFTATWANDANASSYVWMLSTSDTAPASTSDASVKAYGTQADASLTSSTWTLTKTSLDIHGEYFFYVQAIGDGVSYTNSGNTRARNITPLTFDVTSNPGEWPTSNPTTLTDYTYTLAGVDYTFKLNNVKQNSGYLMLTATADLGLPALENYKLTKVVANNSSSCSTSTRVSICTNTTGTAVSGGAAQTWSTVNSSYTYTLSKTSANTVYYMHVTTKNAQLYSVVLTYELVE